ncbi:hypothetical protein [Sphingomonas paeninsulae]|nr:hypothetical protein [Sphingomonas paeninsulae]
MRNIVIGHDLGGTVEVTAGLPGNAKIIDNPPDSLAQGERVRIGKTTHG